MKILTEGVNDNHVLKSFRIFTINNRNLIAYKYWLTFLAEQNWVDKFLLMLIIKVAVQRIALIFIMTKNQL